MHLLTQLTGGLSALPQTATACIKLRCFDCSYTQARAKQRHTADKQPFNRTLIVYTQREIHHYTTLPLVSLGSTMTAGHSEP